MSQFRPLPYKGDHNMVLDLRTVVFNDDNTRIHNWLINHDPNSGTATDKIIYLGELVARTEKELRYLPNIGAKTVRAVKEFLSRLSDASGHHYHLRESDSPEFEGFPQRRKPPLSKEKILEIYEIDLQTPDNVIGNTQKPVKSSRVSEYRHIYTSNDFHIVATQDKGEGKVDITITLPQDISNLIEDGHIKVDATHSPQTDIRFRPNYEQSMMLFYTGATNVSATDIRLKFEFNKADLPQRKPQLLSQFAKVANYIVPRAKQRIIDRYSLR
tara:strand:- start:2269 stop:3081 length:813 start_codon:yes stop_codon:yes gene_type:complete